MHLTTVATAGVLFAPEAISIRCARQHYVDVSYTPDERFTDYENLLEQT